MTEPVLSTAARICAVMGEIGDIPKNGWNSAQSYAFRKIEDVTVRVRDVMSVHGLILIPVASEVVESVPYETDKGKRAHSVLIRETFAFVSVDDSEDRIEVQTVGEGADSLDKATTKALTAAYKYALLQSFAIGEGSDDGDASSGADDAPTSTAASPEQIEHAKSVLALLAPEDLDVVRRWCILAQFGSLSKGHVDSRLLPSFHALVETLSGLGDSTSSEGTS